MTDPETPRDRDPVLAAAAGSGPDQAPVRTLARRTPLVVAPATTLRDTLYRISQSQDDVAIIVDAASGIPLGLVTLRALLHAISMEGGDLDDPVAAHMLGAPLAIDADAPAHRARITMARRGVGHLVLTEADGRLCGLVAQADLLGLRSDGAETLISAIQMARDVQAMVRAADAMRRRATELFHSGMGIEPLCHWISGMNDLVAIRILELIEDEFDLPTVPWCWLVFGSEGRLEQTFSTDQDNGLLFVPPSPDQTEALRAAFLPFAQAVNQALHHCGFERCRGNIMAGNPAWCLSDAEWQGRFVNWLRVPDPQAILHGTIFFDFRPIHGNHEHADRLRAWLRGEAPRHPRFFHALAAQTLGTTPPLGWAGQFILDGRNHAWPRTLDLKTRGARYFMDVARLWALQHGVPATGTADRLRLAGSIMGRQAGDIAADIDAFYLIQRFRMQQQLKTPDPEGANRLNPNDLAPLHRLLLKECFRQATRLQARLRQTFGS